MAMSLKFYEDFYLIFCDYEFLFKPYPDALYFSFEITAGGNANGKENLSFSDTFIQKDATAE